MNLSLRALLLFLPVAVWVLWPAVRGAGRVRAEEPLTRERDLRRRREKVLGELRDLDMDREMGKMEEVDYADLRQAAEREALEIMEGEESTSAGDRPPGNPGRRRGAARG